MCHVPGGLAGTQGEVRIGAKQQSVYSTQNSLEESSHPHSGKIYNSEAVRLLQTFTLFEGMI